MMKKIIIFCCVSFWIAFTPFLNANSERSIEAGDIIFKFPKGEQWERGHESSIDEMHIL